MDFYPFYYYQEHYGRDAMAWRPRVARRRARPQDDLDQEVRDTGMIIMSFIYVFLAIFLLGVVLPDQVPTSALERGIQSLVRTLQPTPARNEMGERVAFWRSYRAAISPTANLDTWFDDANKATDVIQTMWDARPAPRPHEVADYREMRDQIELRAKHLRFAEAEWSTLLDTRSRLLRKLLSAGSPWKVYSDGLEIDSAKSGELGDDWTDAAQKSGRKMLHLRFGNAREVEGLDNQTLSALAVSARGIVEDLNRTHVELFKDWDPSLSHVHKASKAQLEFIYDLRDTSPMGSLWVGVNVTSMTMLEFRLDRLQEANENMRTTLTKWQKQFHRDVEVGLQGEDRVMWVKQTKQLLQDWAALMLGLQEDTLLAIRRNHIRKTGLGAFEAASCSFGEWKHRNCGGTSCFEVPGTVNSLRNVFGLGKPVAGVAEDEISWWKDFEGDGTPRIWRGVYERACCKTGTFARLLSSDTRLPSQGTF